MSNHVVGLVVVAVVLTLTPGPAPAQISDGIVKIGVLNDEAGPYAALAGPGSRVAALMAVEDFGATAKGLKVEIVFADHQNKPDVGTKIAREWFDAENVRCAVVAPVRGKERLMRWGAKPAKARVEAKPPVARKSLENEGSRASSPTRCEARVRGCGVES
jgi:Periplasmic binding protein